MFKTLLIANRGEIACRIIRTAKKLGIKTAAVYSDADANSLHVRMADKAIYIGESPATQSYLDSKKLLDAIKIAGADAVHPGYGFLSENADFVELLEKNKITFVGPSSYAVKSMGDKIQAKKIAQAAGVNVVPGYLGEIKDVKDALKIASKIGYPVML
ncbi:MAG: propionyl-CoA carboxylase, partial [Candidatus Jidaibacter sp.]|nr:propionyl-CoA carboxylase [Candidatus Jidaibacter sp.]